jgi:hypothetical protein
MVLDQAREFTRLVSREIFREAVFLWMTPFAAVLAMVAEVERSDSFAAALSLPSTASDNDFKLVFICERTIRFCNRRFRLCRCLLSADSCVANGFSFW